MLPFTVDFQDGVPVSDQLVLAVRKAILTGQLAKGEEFPSVRTLSQELRMSPTTAHKVVAELKDQGYLASRPGIGMVITLPAQPSRDERIKHLQPACQQLLHDAEELNLELGDVLEALRLAEAGRKGKRN
jgi:DNA-binding transcriptional regulator YhcF (GntR family)